VASRLTEVIIDCADLDRMFAFWSEALGYERSNEGDGWVALRAPGSDISEAALRSAPQPPAVALVVVPEAKQGKNRVHVDITPVDRTQAEEVARLETLGAMRIDISQGAVPWVVMGDPDGKGPIGVPT